MKVHNTVFLLIPTREESESRLAVAVDCSGPINPSRIYSANLDSASGGLEIGDLYRGIDRSRIPHLFLDGEREREVNGHG